MAVPRTCALVTTLVLSAACMPAPQPIPWPIDPDAVDDPARMVIDPRTASPGEVIEIRFPAGGDRGILFALDEREDATWERRAYLLSDANGGNPAAYDIDDDDMMVEMVGISGPGPDRVILPDISAAGDYRICTASAVENVCARIKIEGR